MKTKNIKRIAIALILLLTLSCLLSSCGLRGIRFVGEYTSVFVDSQNKDESISFTLSIYNDKTFVLKRFVADEEKFAYSGSWKSSSAFGKTELICMVEEGYEYSSNYPNAWNPYFALSFLDDGTLMASSGTTVSKDGAIMVFGWGSKTSITMILFEKE